jgi:hypothetical protein
VNGGGGRHAVFQLEAEEGRGMRHARVSMLAALARRSGMRWILSRGWPRYRISDHA